MTLADYLQENPTQQVCRPSQSSWGFKGFHGIGWRNERLDISPLAQSWAMIELRAAGTS